VSRPGKNYSIWFSADQIAEIDAAAHERGVARSALIRKAVADLLAGVDQGALAQRLEAIEKTEQHLFAWLDTLTQALYLRMPAPVKELREGAREAYTQHIEKVTAVIAGKRNGR
jgi:hypothetical protein